ncbi:MAG: hypothetical protein MUP44_09860, partial [Anaerolineales bacterium]|nr:hypothetical protein [Anaerolineales bacterium]
YSEFILLVLEALEAADIPYMIGGAVAAWAWGEPRATRELDLVIQIPKGAVVKLSEELKKRNMLLPADIIHDRLKDRRGDVPLNAIHGSSGYKADLYLLREGDPLRVEAFRRRVLVDLGPGLGELYLYTPEDLILYKLIFYSVSQRSKHIRDIASIVQTMGEKLDTHYIQTWVAEKELHALWKSVQLQIQSKD